MNQYKKLFSRGEELKEKLTEEIRDQVKEIQEISTGAITGVFRSFLGSDPAPTKVIEARSDAFTDRAIHLREDALVLYLPAILSDKKGCFEIVLHRPFTETLHQIYSLFRTTNLDEAEAKFCVLKDKLPVYIEVSKEMFNYNGLQKICDVLAEHPSWNLAHLAAYFACYDSFKDPKINSYLNSTDDETGISPLQVAITTKNLKTVQLLVAANGSLEHLDRNSDTVFHYAAVTSKEIIAALTQGTPPNCLNSRNKNGYTPLHIACQADKPDCVRALLLAGADVNKTSELSDSEVQPGYVGDYLQSHPNSLHKEDMKLGGTPLHWACSRAVVEALIDMNCHIDALNFDRKTALHIMVARQRLECVVGLLSRHADAGLGDADGNRALHLAVQTGSVGIIQCLLVFGVDPNVLNHGGYSARHLVTREQEPKILYLLHAVGAQRCQPGTPHCTEGCIYGGSFDGVPPSPIIGPTNRDALNLLLDVAAVGRAGSGDVPKNGRLLCMDGGGIRGLVLIEMLLEIEKVIEEPIGFLFDWIAGTSTGGILALAIGTGKTMQECLCLYFRIKEKTFIGMRPYTSEPLENVLKETFGEETVMADIRHPKVMITGVLADRKPVDLHLFRNYRSPSEILGIKHDSPYELPLPPEEQYIWQVGRATGAAPTYFRAFGNYLDGGLIANNPTLDAITEIHEYNLALKSIGQEDESGPVSVVVSLGTGLIPVTPIHDVDVYIPSSLMEGVKLYAGISALGTLLVDQATLSDGRVVDRARAWCSYINIPYFRYSPQMSEEIAMNETSDEKLCKMLWETKAYMYKNHDKIKQMGKILKRGQ